MGLVGGLGGFVLPIAFGALNDLTGVWQSCFWLLFAIVVTATVWMHAAVRQMERQAAAEGVPVRKLPELPEMQPIHGTAQEGALAGGGAIQDWRPEDRDFWQQGGRAIARRNLWISVPCLLLSFAVWMVWSVVVAKLPSVGFAFTNDQLFWLASMPGLSGATLRIFYSFMPAMFGGRMWTTLATWSLLVPALGMGFAVQNPGTPYWIFLGLALLCGFGGGNFASSMANISFFFPKAEKATRWRSTPASATSASASCSSWCRWRSRPASSAGSAASRRRSAAAATSGCRTRGSSSCPSSSPRPSRPGSAWTTSPA